ncbi:MAG: hypothetical protein RL173_94 [Fibrobacterota bacterium]|jgi:hypothetical protein
MFAFAFLASAIAALHPDSRFGTDGLSPDFPWYRQYNGDYSYPQAVGKNKFWTVGKLDANPLVPWNGTLQADLAQYKSVFDAEKGAIKTLINAAKTAGEREIHFAIGNEPNAYPYLSPSDYAQAYKMYYDYIKGASAGQLNCGECVVHNGAILLVRLQPANSTLASLLLKAYGLNLKNYDTWTSEFLSKLSALGGKIDAFNVHVYDANLKILQIKGAGIANDLVAAALGSWKTDPISAYANFIKTAKSAGFPPTKVWIDEFGIMNNEATTSDKINSMNRMVEYFATQPEIRRWFWYKQSGTDDKLTGTSAYLKALGITTAMDPTVTGLYDSPAENASLTELGRAYLKLFRRFDNPSSYGLIPSR